MSGAELALIMEELGWTQHELSMRLKVHRNTISAWARGDTPVSGMAEAYLRLKLEVVRLGR